MINYNYVGKFPYFYSIITKKSDVEKVQNSSRCDDFLTTDLSSYNGKDGSFLKTCKQLSNHIKDIITDPKSPEHEFCKYINYWFYDTLKSKKPFSYYSLLHQFYNKIENLKLCSQYQEGTVEGIYEDLNYLYELYDDLYNFKNESSTEGEDNCIYGKNIIGIYETKQPDCKNNYNNEFCLKLIDFREEYEGYKSDVKRCKNSMVYLEPIRDDATSNFLISSASISAISAAFFVSYKVITLF
ncbi:hypothetical protein PVMG_06013 [Plasmodium vivax Mauritania I]|uniref:Uncharacterized protein n=1 Tax=Plasmodium vivax Mauritania I TaxID=1035515 RepID=A0A0J9TJ74_PLAVI|nr:hypothetical protein PVMG_06013 [Plasmodium vivax Mauritania I]